MNRTACLLLLGLGAVALWQLGPAATRGADEKGAVVELDDLKSRAPGGWKQEEIPENLRRFRAYQFRIPRAEGDPRDAELVIFYFGPGGGGTAADNIKRWKGMFQPPEGKTIEDVSKVEKMKVGDVEVTTLDVHGTYLFKERPFDPSAKVEKRPHSRMFGVVFESKRGPFFMRLVGPAKTIEQHKKGFDDWLKAFK
jgi:hypothetical protein